MKKALITGITGQDGSYLAELLLSKGYEVHGIIRRASTFNTERIDHLYQDLHGPAVKLQLHYGDLSDSVNLVKLLYNLKPDEIYHLAAQSHVRVSFDIPEYTADITGVGTMRILEAIRETGVQTRFYQASSSEMYGQVAEIPQRETTPFHPRSPYGVSKVFAYWTTVNYRESYGLHASNGILFNHESPRRGETFVTRKITRAVAYIKAGLQDKLYLGNLDAKRDVAAKSGTSQDFRDAWFIGYTSALVTGIWLGNDDNSPTKHVAGGSLPVEIWSRYMKQALAKTSPVPLPASDAPPADLFAGWNLPWVSGKPADTAPTLRPPALVPAPN